MNIPAFLFAAALVSLSQNGIDLRVEGEAKPIDPGRSVFLTLTVEYPADLNVTAPNLRDRLRGFRLAECFGSQAEGRRYEEGDVEPEALENGRFRKTVEWKLVPEPLAAEYAIAPFVVKASPKLLSAVTDEGKFSIIGGPVKFPAPAAREIVTGGFECEPEKDMPPLSWKLIGLIALALLAAAALVAGLWFGVRYLLRRVKEHRMSPIERAWVELDRLLKKGLPGRGRYKDFYVELTLVVRRYIQRKYGIRAPHLTTEEFIREITGSAEHRVTDSAKLKEFLESADMVKFAGVEATPDMADAATDSARGYLKGDAAEVVK